MINNQTKIITAMCFTAGDKWALKNKAIITWSLIIWFNDLACNQYYWSSNLIIII